MERCWHCGTNPEDPGSARKVTMHSGSLERTVSVATCTACAAILHRTELWLGGLVLLSVPAAIAAGLVAGNWLIGGGGFVLTCVLAGLASRSIRVRGGVRRATNTHPEVVDLKKAGWRLGRAPKAKATTGPAIGVLKTCSRCGRVVAPTAHRGESCPFCGTYWSDEEWKRAG
ncbi:MAG TPA: hypothetical protein VEO00_07950 [Actinomycetota bacterium]|nr:hypothetical protein [Actinomycetota bacterium]